jgi:hypothetical protein
LQIALDSQQGARCDILTTMQSNGGQLFESGLLISTRHIQDTNNQKYLFADLPSLLSGLNTQTKDSINISPTKVYYVKAYAINSAGVSFSNELLIQPLSNAAVTVFPNPAQDVLHLIVTEELLHGVCEIFDAAGRLMQIVNIDNFTFDIDIKNYPKGIYSLKTISKNSTNRNVLKITKN